MASVNNHQQDVDIDLGQLFGAIWQRKGRALLITAAAAALAFGAAQLISPTYRSETRILIEQRTPAYTGAEKGATPENQPLLDELNIASQVQVLQSVDLIKQVARDMKLYEREEFDPTVNPSILSDVMVLFGLKKNPLELLPEERVIKEFTEKLVVYQVEKSRVIGIQFTSKDPKLAAEVPNAIVDVYLALQSGAKLDSNSDATRWLEPEIANLREKVRDAEKKVADYRASRDLLLVGEEQGGTFANRQLTDISAELARVRGERATAEARAQSVRAALKDGRSLDTLTDVVGSQMIQRLKESESAVQAQISDLSTSMLEGHPRLKGLRAQLADIRAQRERETQKILSSLENEARVSQLREQQLLQQLNVAKADTARAGGEEVELKSLEREAAAQRQLLETYLSRYREAASRIDKGSSPADARIISRAILPQEPYFPKVVPIVIVAAMAALVVSAVVIMLMELFSGRALRPVVTGATATVVTARQEDVIVAEEPVQPAQAGEKPAVKRENPAPTTNVAQSLLALQPVAPETADEPSTATAAENEYSLDTVAAFLAERMPLIAVSISPTGDDGSEAIVYLARKISESGQSVILIDLTGSAWPTRLMAPSTGLAGITNLLTGDVAFADTIHSDRASKVHLIPQGGADIRKAMRAADRLSMVIDSLSEVYDLVLVECGPAPAPAVARLLGSRKAEIILSIPQPTEDLMMTVVGDFEKAGFGDLVFLSGELPQAGRQNKAA